MDQDQLADVVKEIEEEKALGRVAAVTVFKGLLNQPELVSLSSANATATGGSYAYSQFNLDMPRPILEAETLQLLAANIPLCTQNIPDTACTFWYYRLDDYANPAPTSENLFFVRLLPSYYKPEFFQTTPAKYGMNVTFDKYPDVETQLTLSCTNDLAYNNLASTQAAGEVTNYYQMQYIPSDVLVYYNSTQNRFQMQGRNTAAPLFAYASADTYAAGTTYDKGTFVSYAKNVYRSLIDGNMGNEPDASPTWWSFVTDKMVQNFVAYTPYYSGQYVANGGTIYQANANIYTGSFSSLDGWVAPTTPYYYRYLVTGYADPNVVLNQGTGLRQWTPYALFEYGDLVQYQSVGYAASRQNKGFLPFYIPNSGTNAYSATVQYAIGDYVWGATNKYYVCIKATKGNAPNTTGYTSNEWWKFIEFTPNSTSVYWKVGDLCTYLPDINNGVFFYKCIKDNNVSQGSPTSTGGVFDTNPYWIPSYWTPQATTTNVPIIGLNAISSRFDMLDVFLNNGWLQFPFPVAIPGQPYNPAPRRLLNSILGFCWNGIFNPLAVSKVLATGATIPDGTTTTDVLNRIRPVPYYKSYGSAAPGLDIGNSTIATIFTADGYGNLVYTNIINIYTTVVYGTTLDSQRNTNLISTASVNAGNLGIAFFANFIDGRLRVNNADIYSISIELRDEVGELYPMTNNGICSFTLKLTYKDIERENKE